MSEHETIDLLNFKGEKIGVTDKAIAHKTGQWHKAVHVWIVNEQKEILLQKRCGRKKLYPKMLDCSFAGHLGAGEDSVTAALREGKEELGLDLKPENLKYLYTRKEKLRYKDIVSNEFADIFVLHRNLDEKSLILQKEEVESVCWIPSERFKKLVKERDQSLLPHGTEYQKLIRYIKQK